MQPPYSSPAADFDHPIDILDGCHERIRRYCGTIARIAEHVATHGADTEARVAAAGVIRYFDTAGANHHRDEEDDLFPALRRLAPAAEAVALPALLAKLKSEHRKLDAHWQRMRGQLAAIVQGHGSGGLTEAEAREFGSAYERHIALEESQLLPLARRILGPELQRELGNSMALRRGVSASAGPWAA